MTIISHVDRERAEKLIAMNRAFKTLRERQKVNLKFYPEIKELAKEVREKRERCVGNQKLFEKVVENLRGRGFNVYVASDSEDAISKVLEVVGDEKLVVKSKSNVTKEIGLREELEKKGVAVVETDIGDRLLQILDESPSHPTGPAVHLSVKSIAEQLSKHYGVEIPPDAEKIVEFLRRDIEKSVEEAKIGITGANAVTAEGSVVILHNEGNVFEVLSRPEKWIVVTGIEKVYESVEDAVKAAKLQSFYATGEILPAFIEIVSGVARTADIEKKLIKVGKPKEVTVILLDNGRSEIANTEFRETLYCLGCGNCVANCPAHSVYGEKFSGGRFALLDAFMGDKEALKLCLSCGKCKKNCPMKIDIPGMIRRAREGNELYNFLLSHLRWMNERLRLEILKIVLEIEGRKKD